ncbi:preprotein translocase subunit SecA [Roseiconus lacunae]|uniref:preprotein translocase subunit SecA n=1 Tax=Roseiconus lacunae TaxID=2605694 RepID=UPI001E38E637|nr:helicase-related protein [Roseiconus lacunae]MCD0458688.1 preprotein translocase subunit SecA [Roseiconus lacunae]
MIERIRNTARSLDSKTDSELRSCYRSLGSVQVSQARPRAEFEMALALACEACRRSFGFRLYDSQLLAGLTMCRGHIAELPTGEGKTLAALLPLAVHSLAGRGAHVVTANDYLARRDAEIVGSVLGRLGLSCAFIERGTDTIKRRQAYRSDITYGTVSEFGFDFLRDRLRAGDVDFGGRVLVLSAADTHRRPIRRAEYLALVDEADSILIDQAKTPLIVGTESIANTELVQALRWADAVAYELADSDRIVDTLKRQVSLTVSGCRKVTMSNKPDAVTMFGRERTYEMVECAITAHLFYHRDKQYIVESGRVVIIDEGTGRKLLRRRWREGLHQAVEIKESVPVQSEQLSAARVTVQSYFRQYTFLTGMTGTASESKRELKHMYRLKTSSIPSNFKCQRKRMVTRVFSTQHAKWEAVAEETAELCASGRSVLIGTASVQASECVAGFLAKHGIHAALLNARHHEEEARIVARAGQPGQVTVATNMAGRGTDIRIAEAVRTLGGLHIIATERHSSPRIDRQLIGRCARQGDPGSYRFMLSLEDDLLSAVATGKFPFRHPGPTRELSRLWVLLFDFLQQQVVRRDRQSRRNLMRREQEGLIRSQNLGLDNYLELFEA